MQQDKIPKTRQGKIKFLNDLKAGKITIADIAGDSFTLWDSDGDNYTNTGTGEMITRNEFEALTLKGTHIILVPAEGCDPIEEDFE
jgi:hypothetical protein